MADFTGNENSALGDEVDGIEEDGIIEFISFQTGKMRRTFSQYPEVLLVDSTYNITSNKMPLSVTMVMDGYGKGRSTSYCCVADERTDMITAVLQSLKANNANAAAQVRVSTATRTYPESEPF